MWLNLLIHRFQKRKKEKRVVALWRFQMESSFFDKYYPVDINCTYLIIQNPVEDARVEIFQNRRLELDF
jgi:hypothetical protein